MKKLLTVVAVAIFATVLIFACKKAGENNSSFESNDNRSASARDAVACNFITLSGDITSNMTLSAANVYKLNGCVTVKSGVTLTIPAGTVLQGIKTTGAQAFLIVERNGKIVANGTPTNPIIFTSDQPVGARAPGDWGGIALFGNANNNNSNSLSVDMGCAPYIGGGTNNADNSGVLKYVQVHFAGAQASATSPSRSAVLLNSVGTGTVVDHMQITNSLNDGLTALGGKVKLDYILSYNQRRIDYQLSFGYQGNMQFIAALRFTPTIVPPVSVYGMNISNHISNLNATPITKPTISNLTVLGPNYCGATSVSANYQYAVRFFNNGAAEMYNSVLSSFNGKGLLIDGQPSVSQTASNNLQFSYNSFHNSATSTFNFISGSSWSLSGGCGTSIASWINGTGAVACRETGNQFSVASLGYDASFCGNFCAAGFSPNLVLGATSLLAPVYSWDTGSAFAHPNYRGAFGSTDWTQGWIAPCPGDVNYCI